MDIHKSFRVGAEALCRDQYSAIHREYGISQVDWNLLTQDKNWTPEQARQVRSILAGVVEVCMTIAGIPATQLPGQYVAAVIAILVGPANRMVACVKAPDTFDALAASGLTETPEIRTMEREQLMGLVIAYSGGYGGEPMPRLSTEIDEIIKKENKK